MVRNIVGALCEVGSGNKPKDWFKVILEVKIEMLDIKNASTWSIFSGCWI